MQSTEHPLARLRRLSRYGARLLSSRPVLETLADRIDTPFSRTEMEAWLAEPVDEEAAFYGRLRQLRNQVWTITAARDLAGLASLGEVTGAFSDLAETTIQSALAFHEKELIERHGQPRNPDGTPMELTVVAMGKLGGRELNVSSDIDLIFLYPEEGNTDGAQPLSHHEFFIRLGKRLIVSISDNTADGYVFRVDMRLRPWGDLGPLAMSYAMLEDYLVSQGRAWERYAWIKSRPITGNRLNELSDIVQPFVFRRYLDFSAFAAIRDLHVQIRREVARRDMQDNIKLGPGGIREIEFAAQVFQLIRGGRIAALQVKPTLLALDQATRHGLLPESAKNELVAAYQHLRKLEHCLQYLDDAQTQRLPEDADSRRRIAEMMGHAEWQDLMQELDAHRRCVTRHFEQIFAAPQTDQNGHPLAAIWQLPEHATSQLKNLGYRDAESAAHQLQLFRERIHQRMPESVRAKLDTLAPPLIELAAEYDDPDSTLTRLLKLVETIVKRSTYLSLLIEYPVVLRQLSRLVAASPWAARLITQQPMLLDELIDPRHLLAAPDWPSLFTGLSAQIDEADGDEGEQMDMLRRFKQAQTLRLLAQDVAGILSVETLSDHLAALADGLLAETLKRVWSGYKQRHCEQPKFAVIGYGKLGGKELGYASDLDLIFLYEDDVDEARALYARFAQRLITWLSTPTGAGILYDTDLRLRPDGASGLLVSSLEAYEDYQLHHAWVWEHQALTRARYVAGDAKVGEKFEVLRRRILSQPREPRKLKEEVVAMRQKMHDGHPNPTDQFDIKHDRGGIVDVEFCVQYLILAHAHEHPQLLDNLGNIALLKRCGEIGLLPADLANAAADAYRELRRRQHAVKLAGADQARINPAELEIDRNAVNRLSEIVLHS